MASVIGNIEKSVGQLADLGTLVDLGAGAAGLAGTAIVEGFAFPRFRGIFGDNSGGKGSLTIAQFAGRIGLYAGEAVLGLAAAREKGAVGIFGEGMAYAAAWHAIRATKLQFVGSQPILGLPI